MTDLEDNTDGETDTQTTTEETDQSEDVDDKLTTPVERAFTCPSCGFATVEEVPLLQRERHGVCVNCGQWSIQSAPPNALREAAEEVATTLAGEILTERQALAYILREILTVDRETAAEVMDSTPSNVDNLQRRATKKLDDARRTVSGIETLHRTVIPGEAAQTDSDGTKTRADAENL